MAAPLTINILQTNQTAVIMDVNTYQCDKTDATLFTIIGEVEFFEYPHCLGTGYSNFNLFSGDTVLVKAQFHVKQGTELSPILLKNISANIIAVRQNDLQEVNLETFTINTYGFLQDCSNIQHIDFAQERDFILPSTDCRNEIRLFRMPYLDITGYSAYEFIYPFKVRWEEWRSLQGADRCFPEPTQNWVVYANQTGWSIKFSIKAQIEQTFLSANCLATNPIITDFEHITWGTIKDECDIPYAVEFNTFDTTGLVSYEGVVATDVNTFVEATIVGDFTGFTANQLYGILTLDAWGVGGTAYAQEIGTHINIDADSVWYGASSTLVATLTKVSNNTLTLSAFLNYLYLPKDTNQYIFSVRIGEYRTNQSSSGFAMTEFTICAFSCGELEIVEVVNTNTLIVSGVGTTAEKRDVWIDSLIITFLTATTWTISGGTINGYPVTSGTLTGNIIQAPVHPYTDANVGDMILGEIEGSLSPCLEVCPSICLIGNINGGGTSTPCSTSVQTLKMANGFFYTNTLQISGGTAPYILSIIAGSLPTGASLSGNVISGFFTSSGNFTIKAVDANGCYGTQQFIIPYG